MPPRILVPIDFSRHSEAVVDKATEMAQALGGTLALLHVHEPIVTAPPFGDVMPVQPPAPMAEFDSRLGKFAQARADSGVDIETRCVMGAAAVEILRLAREQPFDMIVMGTHGLTGWKHLLLGSVAERVVRETACPVLVVPVRGAAATSQ